MTDNLQQCLYESITMYSACLENPEKHMTLLSNAARRIEQLEAECHQLREQVKMLRDALLRQLKAEPPTKTDSPMTFSHKNAEYMSACAVSRQALTVMEQKE